MKRKMTIQTVYFIGADIHIETYRRNLSETLHT